MSGQCAEVLRIPVKRAPKRNCLIWSQMRLQLSCLSPTAPQSRASAIIPLLALLYNTGARIQEALDLCPRSVRLDAPAQVRLMGKGRKERTCPLWPETVDLLKALLKRQPRPDDQPIFVNRYGQPARSPRGSIQTESVCPSCSREDANSGR